MDSTSDLRRSREGALADGIEFVSNVQGVIKAEISGDMDIPDLCCECSVPDDMKVLPVRCPT